MGSQDAQRPLSLQLRLNGMHAEEQRLRTFVGWPLTSGIDSKGIARAGFFYTGRGLEVECFACRCRISDWNYADSAIDRHRELNPNCSFVLNPNGSSNIPIAFPSSSPPAQVEQKGYRSEASVYDRGGPDYRKEEVRLASFCREDGKRWPVPDKVSPSALAKAGFYWNPSSVSRPDADISDRVTCAFCNGSLGGWESGDDPQSEHHRCLIGCPFVVGAPVGNVPLSSPTTSPMSTAAAVASSGKEEGCSQAQPRSVPDEGSGGNQFGNERLVEMVSGSGGVVLSENQGAELLGVHRHKGPRNERYATTEARIASFLLDNQENTCTVVRCYGVSKSDTIGWPVSRVKQTPRALAEAGFFYTGQSDQVRCFYCDGGLWNWQEEDDPWLEHTRWFPNCAYVLLVKGEAFVEAVKNMKPPTNSAHCNSSASSVSPGIASSSSNSRFSQLQGDHATGSSGEIRRVHPIIHNARKIRSVNKEELDALMGSPSVMMALEIGLDAGRVRNIVQRKIEKTGVPFASPDDLVLEVLGSQKEERDNIESDDDSEDDGFRFFRGRRTAYRQPNRRFFRSPAVLQDDSDSDAVHDHDSDEGSEERNPEVESDRDTSDGNEEGEVEAGEIVPVEDVERLIRELDGNFLEHAAASSRNHEGPSGEPISQLPENSEATAGIATDFSDVAEAASQDENVLDFYSSRLTKNRISARQVVGVSRETARIVFNNKNDGIAVQKGESGSSASGIGNVDSESVGIKSDSSVAVGIKSDSSVAEGIKSDSSVAVGIKSDITVAISASLAALEEENRRFRESRLCKVCLDEEVGVVFLPCGHLVSCVHCAPSLKDCPMCRRSIGATVRTYLS
ncbi:death-associated inhibitor of apoptosis 2-like [Hetaerina americana]|uniref:death-associated inhibitor of apoptosis 2-like n=1 Tax=Hetaerina americana TaxID=62018 RepID=UPI003A7F3F43